MEIGVLGIHLIDVEELGLAHLGGQLVGFFGAHIDAGLGGDDDEDAFRGADALAHPHGEVKQPRAVDEVYLVVLPLQGSHGGGHRDLPANLLLVAVADGVSIGGLSQTVGSPGPVQHRLRQGGLSAPAVAGDGNVSDLIRHILFHGMACPFLFPNQRGNFSNRRVESGFLSFPI